tara:strand:- start:42 stop:1421 length:1380 start_codon:yes stop_codon:yes gene_type:complete
MSKNISEELPARKHAPAAAPVQAKQGGKGKSESGSVEEASAKRIRQAVYDIRYRARREDIDLKAAYAQYMSNSSLSQAERTAVREKLFGKEGGGVKEQVIAGADDWAIDNLSKALYKVFSESGEGTEIELAYLKQLDEEDNQKYKIRVTGTDGVSYVRYGDRAKITELRQNPKIKSVEMTEHGTPYEGERKRGAQTAKAKGGLDPVGKEDADVNNDGKKDSQDDYLLKRRKTITTAIKKKAKQKLQDSYIHETNKKIDNYKKGENGKTAVTIAPQNSDPTPEVKAASNRGIYSHLELTGTELSESQKRFLEFVAEKAACKSKKKKTEEYSEATVNTPDCEKKPKEKEKDMRGTYTAINLVKNKLRSQGCKNPIVMLSDVGGDKKVSEERTAGYPGGPANMGKPSKKPGDNVKGPVEKDPEDKVKGPAKQKAKNKKNGSGRYNPFKDGRTPTSASETTGP